MTHSMCRRKIKLLAPLLWVLFIADITWFVGAAMPALSQTGKGSGAMNGPKSIGDAEPRYLLFWRAPEQAPGLIKTLGAQGDGRTRLLGFGVPCSTFVQEKQVADSIYRAFAIARQYHLALILHFDFHVEWPNRPDLWNWFDPKKPGYNPDNRRNVEWFGWDGPPRERAT